MNEDAVYRGIYTPNLDSQGPVDTSGRTFDHWSLTFASALFKGVSSSEAERYIEVLSATLAEGSLTVVVRIFRSQGSARVSFEFALEALRSYFQPNDPETVALICIGTMIETWPRSGISEELNEDLDLTVRVPPRNP